MKSATFEWYGYDVKVGYYVDEEDNSIDIVEWSFESDEILDELNLYNDHARAVFEDELAQMVADYESQQKDDLKRLKAYLKAKARRINNR